MGCSRADGGKSGNEYVYLMLPSDAEKHGTISQKARSGIVLMNVYLAVYRLNTYPLIHLGFLHALLNTLALAPLLERFEADHGTLLTAAMFIGRESAPKIPMRISFADRRLIDSLIYSPRGWLSTC